MMRFKFAAFLVLMIGYGIFAFGQNHALQVFDSGNSPLPEDNIRALCIAPDSTLWIGTENGLVTLKNGSWDSIDTLAGYQIRSIAFDGSQRAWVGTFLNGLWVQNDTGWVNYTSANSTLPDDYVRTIAFCPSGDAWLGTVGGAVQVSNATWTVYRQNNTNWYTEHVASAYCTPANEVWLGGINSGLMHQVDTGWVIYRTIATGLPDNTILDIQGDPNGALWLAMPAAGAASFDGNLGWVYYNSTTSFNPSNSLNSIAIGNNGSVYFASTDKGLVVYKGGLEWFNLSSTVRPDTAGTYLPGNELITVVHGADGALWASASNAGLLRIQFLGSTTHTTSLGALSTTLLYPNPATDFAIVQSPIEGLSIVITDVAGHTVFTTTAHSPQTKIPLSHLPKGMYMVVLSLPDARTVHRLLVY